ncbi:response regulator [Helicobacter saguini]|uniref:Response regulator n=1 Tax=Helicobacter saguini TaxID=1548018 RepID=A0A347VRL1_9HELI|nr:response regulator transcription factor [Helicobacter saguini]MWV62862.1 response regulator [Helicobacter saguini]MWV66467.1 response regulator [Helicobacter saguini]MWV68817.1 response regulator [Helicobacter saguini]MWV71628.1 response regulator [Helicobacter saguini]TLD94432.1 response regulator transcription factor [Helicobacter saguini]
MIKILVLENDLETFNSLQQYLSEFDYEPIFLESTDKILSTIMENRIDVILIDLVLNDADEKDKFYICRQIREITKMPIIITSFSNDVGHKISAFEDGADDYLTKPYHLDELNARIKALLRRLETQEMIFGSLQIDPKKRIVKLKNEYLELTNTEFDILLFLIENRLQPVSRDRIAHTINAIHEDTGLRSIDTHIRNLRNKLGDSAKEPKYIQSVWGIGYKFCI